MQEDFKGQAVKHLASEALEGMEASKPSLLIIPAIPSPEDHALWGLARQLA